MLSRAAAVLAVLVGLGQRPASGIVTTWSGASGGSWSNSVNWSTGEPNINNDAVFPSNHSGNVVLSLNEAAHALGFQNNYALGGGSLTLNTGEIFTTTGVSTTIGTPLIAAGGFGVLGLTKLGPGTLTLSGTNTFQGTVGISDGTLRVDTDARLGNTNSQVVIDDGTLSLTSSTFTTSRTITLSASGAALNFTAAGELRVNNGTLNINGGTVSCDNGRIGYASGSNGHATVNSANSTWANSTSIAVGYQGTGDLSIQAGGSVSDVQAHIGSLANSTGTATVTGNGSTWTSSGFLGVGYTGTGTLNIEAGGSVSSDSSFVATDPGSIGHVSVTGSGSTWTVTGSPVIGEHGTATLTISAGGHVSGSAGFIGRFSDGDGTMTVTDAGSMWSSTGELFVGDAGTGRLTVQSGGSVSNSNGWVGYNASGDGTATITDTGSTWTNTGDLIVGPFGTGTLNIQAGADVSDVNGILGQGSNSHGTATVTGTGSTWTHTGNLKVGDSGIGILNIESGGSVSSPIAYVGYFTNSNGTVTVSGAGSTLTCSNNLFVGGSFPGTGSLTIQNGGHVSSNIGNIGSSGISTPSHGTTLITGAGSSWTVTNNINVGYQGIGDLTIDAGGSLSCTFAFFGFGSGATATATVTGANSLWSIMELDMSNDGATSTLNINGGTVSIAGNIVDGGAGISTITLDGGLLDMQNHTIGGATPVDNLNFRSGTLRNVTGINNGAGLTKTSAGTLIFDRPDTYTGPTAVNDGILRVANTSGSATGTGSVTIANGATIQGSGFISGPVQNNGFVTPGTSAGILTFSNTYAQNAAGSLDIEIGGTAVGVGYDRLAVNGAATLGGTLRVTLINGFNPSIGDAFTILTCGSRTGTFANATGLDIGSGKVLRLQYNPTSVVLTVIPAVPGDMNCDGLLNQLDVAPFTIAMIDAVSYQQQFPDCNILNGDMNHDLVLDGLDIAFFINCLVNGSCP